MSRCIVRSWRHAGADDGGFWPRATMQAFERLMGKASEKVKGEPRVVAAWDNGGDARAWYNARPCAEETSLRDQCRALFGQRERAPEGAPR